MPKLPSLQLLEAPAWQLERLQAWIEEWTLDLTLRKELSNIPSDISLPDENLSPEPFLDLVHPYDERIEVGQLRLLGPDVVCNADHPIFVAILGDTPRGLFLTAPFSRFSLPATPGEYLMGRTVKALRVLSLWNTRLFDSRQLEKSWLIGKLTEAESDVAWKVFESQIAGQALPETLATQVGPPVVHPKDPRLQYQAEESAVFDAIGAAVDILPSNILIEFLPLRNIQEAIAEQEFALAADTGGTAFSREVFEVPAYSVFVRAYLASDANIVFMVHDSSGDISEALDGTNVVAKDGRILASIRKGTATFPLFTPLPDVGLRRASGDSIFWRESTTP